MRNDWKVSFRALWIAEFLAVAGFQTSTPILPLYLKDLGVQGAAALNAWNGIINGGPSLLLALAAPVWGSLADSYGKKPMLLRATIGGAGLLGLMALVTAPWQLLVLKLFQGIVTGTVAAATVLTATIVPEEETGYRLGLLQMSVFLGATAGPLIGGVITDLASARVTFLVTAALLGLASLLVGRYVHEDHVVSIAKGESLLARMLPDRGLFAATPLLLGLLLCVFAIQLANGIANPILPLIIDDMNGGARGTGSLAGLIIGASSLSGALAAALIGRVSTRFGYGNTLVTCLLAAFVFYIPQGFARSPWLLLALRVASGAFLGGTIPSVNALIARVAKKGKQGAVFGLSSSVSSGGSAVGPLLGALIATVAGYPSVFYATGAILALTGLMIAAGIGRPSSVNVEPENEDPVPPEAGLAE